MPSDTLSMMILDGEYRRPPDLSCLLVPFVYDSGLTKCRASDEVLDSAMDGPSILEHLADEAACHIGNRRGEHWLDFSSDPAMVSDLVRQFHQSGDRERTRRKLTLTISASGAELQSYSRLRNRLKW